LIGGGIVLFFGSQQTEQQQEIDTENTNYYPLQYFQLTGDAEILSGVIPFTGGEAVALLHIPVGKRTTLYLSGNGESQIFLLAPDANQSPSHIKEQKELLTKNAERSLDESSMNDFYQVYSGNLWYKFFHF
jgi:hypothetical protein